MTDDRTVHAHHPDGRQVVRYDRAGKWWLEYDPPLMRPARHIGVREAAQLALQLEQQGGTIVMGLPGGKMFDHLVRVGRVPLEGGRVRSIEDLEYVFGKPTL